MCPDALVWEGYLVNKGQMMAWERNLLKKGQMTRILVNTISGQQRWLAFLLTRGLESWIGDYLEQLDEIPEVKAFNFYLLYVSWQNYSHLLRSNMDKFPEVIERVVVVVQVLLQGAGHGNDCLAEEDTFLSFSCAGKHQKVLASIRVLPISRLWKDSDWMKDFGNQSGSWQ